MRSRTALALLLLVTGFVLGSVWDRCGEGEDECAPLCHASCLDGCATAPVPRSAEPATLIRVVLAAFSTPAAQPLVRSDSPDIQPPRA